MSGSTGLRCAFGPGLLAALCLLLLPTSCADHVVFSSNTGTACGKGRVWVSGYTTSNGTYVPGYCRGGTVVVVSNFVGRAEPGLVDGLQGHWELTNESGDEPLPTVLLIGGDGESPDLFDGDSWWPEATLGTPPVSVRSMWTRDGLQAYASGENESVLLRLELDDHGEILLRLDRYGSEAPIAMTRGSYRRR